MTLLVLMTKVRLVEMSRELVLVLHVVLVEECSGREAGDVLPCV
jgi:hypothetical protein